MPPERRERRARRARPTPARSPKSTSPPRRELSIDELARVARSTVRNVRAYQDRGLLPPPERRGRKGIYTDAHLARLRVITQLLERGYSLANIGELLEAWQSGRDLEPILGFETAIASPFFVETPGELDAATARSMFVTEEALAQAVALGIVEPDPADASKYRVPSPKTLRAGLELVAASIPGPVVLEELRLLRKDMERVAGRLVTMIVEHVLGGRTATKLPRPGEIERLSKLVMRLRPLAEQVVDAELARALEHAARLQLGDRLDRVLETIRGH